MLHDRARACTALVWVVVLVLVSATAAQAEPPIPTVAPSAEPAGQPMVVPPAPPPVEVAPPAERPAPTPAPAAAAVAAPTSAPDASPVAAVRKGEVFEEIHISKDTDLSAVLRMLTLQTRDNVVLSGKVDGSQKVEANLYNVSFEQVLESLLTPLGLAYQRQGNFIYVYTRKELDELAKKDRIASSAVFKLNYVTATDAATLIKPLLSQVGQVAVTSQAAQGIESGTGGTGGNSYATQDALVVTDYPENLRQIAKVIHELDLRPRQVLIEATILRATLNEDNALGVDFNVLGGIDFASLDVSTADSGGTNPGSTSTSPTPHYPGNAVAIDGNLPNAALNGTTFNAKTDFLDPALFPRGGFSFGIIKNNIAAFIRALESVTDTTVVANPKVLALNKQKGEVIVGRRDGYLTTITTETSEVQKVEFLETGVQLLFRPYIGDDGYVRMELHPEDSNGALSSANLPFEETTEVTTNLLVKDGHTIVIGGLFREQTTATRAQVPFLGNLPYAGALFRRKRDTTIREEVIVLLTVHIVEDEQAYSKEGEQALGDIERIRVGLRQNLMCHGRERLAQAHYKAALTHLTAGNMDKALWELDMALYLQPRFVDAIRKKEELTNQRAWDGNGSLIHNFIYNRLIHAEDRWVDTMGQAARDLSAAPDANSPEWGDPVRSMESKPATPPADSTTQPSSSATLEPKIMGSLKVGDGGNAGVANAAEALSASPTVIILGTRSVEGDRQAKPETPAVEAKAPAVGAPSAAAQALLDSVDDLDDGLPAFKADAPPASGAQAP